MAFVRFYTLLTDHYFPEHQVLEMKVVDSDDTQKGPHMTLIVVKNADGEIQRHRFYVEPVFV